MAVASYTALDLVANGCFFYSHSHAAAELPIAHLKKNKKRPLLSGQGLGCDKTNTAKDEPSLMLWFFLKLCLELSMHYLNRH